MLYQINTTFKANLNRVDVLLKLHQHIGAGRGNPTLGRTDILRAAVVFLHMAMEDYLRSLGKWKCTETKNHDLMANVRLKGCKSDKFVLWDLMNFQNQTVTDVMEQSIEAYFDRESFNNIAEVMAILKSVDINESQIPKTIRSKLSAMMKRRHHIAHQGDINRGSQGRGVHRFRRLARPLVVDWRDAVEQFHKAIDALI